MTLAKIIRKSKGRALDELGWILDLPRIRADWSMAIVEADEAYRARLQAHKLVKLLTRVSWVNQHSGNWRGGLTASSNPAERT
jgi:hypothetical protein